MKARKNTSEDFKRALAAYYSDLRDFLDDGYDIVQNHADKLEKVQTWMRAAGEFRALLTKRLEKLPPPVEKKPPPPLADGLVWPPCPVTGRGELWPPKAEAEHAWGAWLRFVRARTDPPRLRLATSAIESVIALAHEGGYLSWRTEEDARAQLLQLVGMQGCECQEEQNTFGEHLRRLCALNGYQTPFDRPDMADLKARAMHLVGERATAGVKQ